jgi:hypothetical protein
LLSHETPKEQRPQKDEPWDHDKAKSPSTFASAGINVVKKKKCEWNRKDNPECKVTLDNPSEDMNNFYSIHQIPTAFSFQQVN